MLSSSMRGWTVSLLLLFTLSLTAQRLTLQVPSQVEVGQQFRVSYSLNSNDFDRIHVDGGFTGLEVLFGPSISTSSSIMSVNGKTTQSSSTTFTYTVVARKAGHVKIPSASLKSAGKSVRSNTATVQVLPSSGTGASGGRGQAGGGQGMSSSQGFSGGAGSGSGSPNRMHTPSSKEHISAKDLYFTVTTSKKKVFEQEAVLLTYKLYSLVTVEQLAGEIPQLDGFHTQEIELPQQRSFTMERVGGKNYGTVVWRQYVLFPQKTGKLTIPAVDYEADIVTQDYDTDPFDAFFGGGSLMQRVKKTVRAPKVEIEVLPLPEKPANFSGAVGKGFSIQGKLSPQKVDANDATTLTLTVKGTGNIKLITSPTIQWPKDFETYDPKASEKVSLTSAGNSGTLSYECIAVPHHAGTYTIPAVEFCYFDTDSHQYKTVKTGDFSLEVNKSGRPVSQTTQQSELKELDNDIRYIKMGMSRFKGKSDTSFGSPFHLWSYAVLLLVFSLFLIIFRRYAKANADFARQRGRKAGRAASKRLKKASSLLQAGKSDLFYDEVMRALWGYVADKLDLVAADLNKDNISELLAKRQVGEETIQRFLTTLSNCEFARFAPGDPASTMDNLFTSATEIINQLDEEIVKS